MYNEKEQPKIAIIGAGIAGLSCARHLTSTNKNLVINIFESQEIHGGRIRALKGFSDVDIELGAEEVHGESSPYYKLIEKNGGKLFDFWNNFSFYFEYKNELLSEDTLYKKSKQAKQVMDFFKDLKDSDNKTNYEDITVREYAKKYGIGNGELDYILDCFLAVETASDIDKMSVKGILNLFSLP